MMVIDLRLAMSVVLSLAAAAPTLAQIVVSANDGKQRAADSPAEQRTADGVTILDLASNPPRILGEIAAPASMIGPPASVAISARRGIAIVTGGQKIDGSGALAPDDQVSVIDISRPRAPRLLQTAHAGEGAGAVAIDESKSLALVANSADDTVSTFAIKGRALVATGTVTLSAKSKPVEVIFCCDRQTAFVVTQGSNLLTRLAIVGDTARLAGGDIAVGAQPYSIAVNRRTSLAYVSNMGGRTMDQAGTGPRIGTIGIVDLKEGKMLDQVDVGIAPENVALSPSGRFLEVTLINGSSAPSRSPAYHDHGIMKIYSTAGRRLKLVAEAPTGRWCQGAVWRDDEKRVILQCGNPRQLETYQFDGAHLRRDATGTLPLQARPGAIATARSR